jgi:hypothetical protein
VSLRLIADIPKFQKLDNPFPMMRKRRVELFRKNIHGVHDFRAPIGNEINRCFDSISAEASSGLPEIHGLIRTATQF